MNTVPHRAAAQSAAARLAGRGAPGAALALLAAAALLPGCYAPQLGLLQSGLDSLRAVVDTMAIRDEASYRLVAETRREVAEQRDILLSTRASSGSTTQELFEQMGTLESKLDEVMGRFQQFTERARPTPGVVDPNQLYDQASQDLTQGRYALALQSFRDFVRQFPVNDLADNAEYGIGECFFAQAAFDSAAVEYAKVEALYPQGDKVPAALYKLALCQEKLGQKDTSRKTFQELVKRFPLSGEAQLARERLGTSTRR
ncbi:MAG: tol-pal system protein YbgF [Candidatus Eisenbacteria bacterium RBG_16_71_46]|nr:MAG: tol-pal system protein YbgF [Candidatus Eisenbacteria bacterium RBG_16_71_46]OGF24146.1 MAG: tol-pal system protein YbgF [Candidatus Eisenbacteria bacterium RBG_19FT_COMBO_70_11]